MKTWTSASFSRKHLYRDLVTGLLIAIGFSLFLYSAHWDITAPAINTFAGLAAIWGLLTRSRRSIVFAGFFIGLLWFYWIGFSFRYYNLPAAVPFVALFFGAGYGLIFGIMSLTKQPYLRALILFGISFIEPFDFNWMVPELLFLHSWFGIESWQFALILIAVATFATFTSLLRYASLIILVVAFDFPTPPDKPLPDLKFTMIDTHLQQEKKWLPEERPRIFETNFEAIDRAIDAGDDLVILSEAAFPAFLNMEPETLELLKEKSRYIAIITGALLFENGQNYNVTYFFNDGIMQVAKKTVLVPFGEYIPLPGFLKDVVNQLFFNGASDYVNAEEPTDFIIKGIPFRSAICYEATCPEIYRNDPKYMIAISNNAWFTPSVEPTLQRLLMQYYARKHGTLIIHVANMAGTGIIR